MVGCSILWVVVAVHGIQENVKFQLILSIILLFINCRISLVGVA